MFRDLFIFSVFLQQTSNVGFPQSAAALWLFTSQCYVISLMPPVKKHQELGRLMSLARKVGQYMQEAVLQRNSLTTASGGQ